MNIWAIIGISIASLIAFIVILCLVSAYLVSKDFDFERKCHDYE